MARVMGATMDKDLSANWLVSVGALLVATFAIVTSEMVIAGLLPALATDLGVTIPVAGQLITGYAIGVGIAGPILALLTARLSRRVLLISIMGFYVAGNVFCALAQNYWGLMGARLILAACHGIHFGVAMVVATRLAPEGRQATAISVVVAGVSAATILGVPLGTAIGNAYGWRASLWALSAVGVVSLVVLALFIPRGGGEAAQTSDIKAELAAAIRPICLLCYAIFGTLLIAYFMMLAYIVPFLTDVAAVPLSAVPLVLLVMGAASFAGTLIGGRLGDRNQAATITGALTLTPIFLALLWQFAFTSWLAILLIFLAWIAAFSAAPSLQGRLIRAASDAPNFASTLMNTSGQAGIAVGAALGGLLIASGWGYSQLPIVASAFSAIALLLTLLLFSYDRRRAPAPA